MRTLILAVAMLVSVGYSRAGGLIIVQTNSMGTAAAVPGRDRLVVPRDGRWVPPQSGPRGWRFPLAALQVASEKVDVKVKDQVASVSIEQEFYNPNAQQLEGTFLFPIPKGAQLDQFKMEIGGRMVEPELLSAEKARRIYEDIVRAARDPALLEFEGRDLLKARIFPIEANSRKKIALSYTQVLKQDAGLLEFVLPIAPQKYSAGPTERFSLNLELETTTALKTVYSPSHNVELSRPASRRAVVKLDERELAADKDFHLLYSYEKSEVALQVMTHRDYDGDGYFLLFASPGIEANEKAVVAKDVAFVLDTSGSMSGEKIEQARKALLFCVRNLNEADRFEVLRFSTETEGLFHELRPASRENVRTAERFIEGLKPQNGTAIDDALKEALELRSADSERPFVVIFLTDGLPTVGETRVEKIVENVKERARSARIFCFGIGSDVNTRLLDKIAEETRAFSQYVTAGEDIEVKVSSFYSKIRDPLLANIKINLVGGDGVRLTKQYPSALPDLYKGEQLIVAGRYSGNGSAKVRLQGTVNGVKKTFTASVDFPEHTGEHDFIPRLWATRRVGSLLDQIRLNGENSELRDEVTGLARKYGIVTPYTAYLIMEDETRRGVSAAAQTLPDAMMAPMLRESVANEYRAMKDKQTGEAAVNATVANQALRQAQNVQSYNMDRYEMMRSFPQPGMGGASAAAGRVQAKGEARQPAQQTQQFVAGRTFYQNGNQWVDTTVQTLKAQAPRRIQFNSESYFALLTRYPKLAPVLALGSHVQFVHEGDVIEIYE